MDRTLGAAASAIGITYNALRHAMHSGATIADVARAHHVGLAKVEAAMTAAAQHNAATAAARRHRIDARYESRIPKIVNAWVNGRLRKHHRRA